MLRTLIFTTENLEEIVPIMVWICNFEDYLLLQFIVSFESNVVYI